MMKKIKKSLVLRVLKALGSRVRGAKLAFAQENPKDKDIDLFNDKQEYITTVDPRRIGIAFKKLVEQNEAGIGRPKIKRFILKKNKVKFTIREIDSDVWNFLPYMGIAQIRMFLKSIDEQGDHTDIVSKLVRGEIVDLQIPENRIPYLKGVYKEGATANPYYKESKDPDKGYLVEKFNKNWKM